ncbi:hypothetical protein K504DRAFT_185277 [Pleomassaria siparia CBS 279.74]|uniref:Uncharacterized protein n=1 Tax=Pleomassaria siparia CBS 279.74 TaxID=1314801 RepID=A0A6G1JSG5_9PLEO|nr:hypothetical protein K504DRAFT_185277 [Pleomassaria siparia CBS 279.74]
MSFLASLLAEVDSGIRIGARTVGEIAATTAITTANVAESESENDNDDSDDSDEPEVVSIEQLIAQEEEEEEEEEEDDDENEDEDEDEDEEEEEEEDDNDDDEEGEKLSLEAETHSAAPVPVAVAVAVALVQESRRAGSKRSSPEPEQRWCGGVGVCGSVSSSVRSCGEVCVGGLSVSHGFMLSFGNAALLAALLYVIVVASVPNPCWPWLLNLDMDSFSTVHPCLASPPCASSNPITEFWHVIFCCTMLAQRSRC